MLRNPLARGNEFMKKKKEKRKKNTKITRFFILDSFVWKIEIQRSFHRVRIVAPVAEFKPYSNPLYRVKWTFSSPFLPFHLHFSILENYYFDNKTGNKHKPALIKGKALVQPFVRV